VKAYLHVGNEVPSTKMWTFSIVHASPFRTREAALAAIQAHGIEDATGAEQINDIWYAVKDSSQFDEIAILRKEIESGFTRIRGDIQQGKLDTAEQHANYMRNWLAILTSTVTVAFVGFGILGITRFSDIQMYRTQMEADAKKVSEQTNSVEINARKVADSAGAVTKIEEQVGGLENRMKDLESRYQKADVQLTSGVNHANALAQQTRFDLQTSLGSTASGLGFPTISKVTFAGRSGLSTIDGFNFGDSQGRIYVSFLGDSSFSALAHPDSFRLLQGIELQSSSIKQWNNKIIKFGLSPTDILAIQQIAPDFTQNAIPSILGVTQPSVMVRVVTAEGISSISSNVSSLANQ
jgi:hypothetical protein